MDAFFGSWRCNCTSVQHSNEAIERNCPKHSRELLGPVQAVEVPEDFNFGVEADLHYNDLKNSGELERRRDIAVQAQQLAYQSATGSVL